jgi:hypothetical protein
MKAKTAGTIALAVVTPIIWWGTYRTFKPFSLSDLSGYDWSMVPFTVEPGFPAFLGRNGVKTMKVTLVYPTDDRARLRNNARAVCLRCAAEMSRLLPNEHRAVKLTVYGPPEGHLAPPKEGQCQGYQVPVGDLTIDDPTRETVIPDSKENWH